MDEQSWLNGQDPAAMLQGLRDSGKTNDRKLRLFAVACVRRVWHLLTDERSRRAVEISERYADGEATPEELTAAEHLAEQARGDAHYAQWVAEAEADFRLTPTYCAVYAREWATSAARTVVTADAVSTTAAHRKAAEAAANADFAASGKRERSRPYRDAVESAKSFALKDQAGSLRDLFGNPFRPVALEPAWLTPQVVALARRAYDERRLPEGTLDRALLAALADALEDAGCTDPDVLRHLRWEDGHVRGCWVVDLLLQKE